MLVQAERVRSKDLALFFFGHPRLLRAGAPAPQADLAITGVLNEWSPPSLPSTLLAAPLFLPPEEKAVLRARPSSRPWLISGQCNGCRAGAGFLRKPWAERA